MKYLGHIVILIFTVLAVIFGVFIFRLNQMDRENLVQQEIKSKIILIRNGYKGKPNYKIMELESGQSFTIPESVINVLQIGDSVYKDKGNDFYTFVNAKTKQRKKITIR